MMMQTEQPVRLIYEYRKVRERLCLDHHRGHCLAHMRRSVWSRYEG